MTAREEILATIRTALHVDAANPAGSYARITAQYNRIGKLDRNACLELFLDRLIDYDTEIFQVATESELPAAIAEALTLANEHTALVPCRMAPRRHHPQARYQSRHQRDRRRPRRHHHLRSRRRRHWHYHPRA